MASKPLFQIPFHNKKCQFQKGTKEHCVKAGAPDTDVFPTRDPTGGRSPVGPISPGIPHSRRHGLLPSDSHTMSWCSPHRAFIILIKVKYTDQLGPCKNKAQLQFPVPRVSALPVVCLRAPLGPRWDGARPGQGPGLAAACCRLHTLD